MEIYNHKKDISDAKKAGKMSVRCGECGAFVSTKFQIYKGAATAIFIWCGKCKRMLTVPYRQTDKPTEEWHAHPVFNGQGHRAIWIQTWVSDGTNATCPEDAPISCAVCGRVKSIIPS